MGCDTYFVICCYFYYYTFEFQINIHENVLLILNHHRYNMNYDILRLMIESKWTMFVKSNLDCFDWWWISSIFFIVYINVVCKQAEKHRGILHEKYRGVPKRCDKGVWQWLCDTWGVTKGIYVQGCKYSIFYHYYF